MGVEIGQPIDEIFQAKIAAVMPDIDADTVKLMQFDVLTAHTVIHMHFLDWKGIGVITRALRHENVTLVAQEHMRMDFGREQMKRTLVRRAKDWLKQRLYRYATRDCQMIGVSDAVYQDLCRIRGEHVKTYLVRNAISTRRLDGAWDNALSLDPMRDVVIFGTHFERKGVDVALRAVMKAKSRLRLVVLAHREAETQAKLDAVEPEWRNYAAVYHVVENIRIRLGRDLITYALLVAQAIVLLLVDGTVVYGIETGLFLAIAVLYAGDLKAIVGKGKKAIRR